MTEKRALELLQKGDQAGLIWMIDHYTAYVGAVVWNVLGGRMSRQDAEEVTADVFLTLWRNAEKPLPGKVKGYLGSIARSRALNRLRSQGFELALEEDILSLPADGPEELYLEAERRERVRAAVQAMGMPDREIFVRYYYYCESASSIADALHMTPAAVRQRLKRGRDALREELGKEKEEWNTISAS